MICPLFNQVRVLLLEPAALFFCGQVLHGLTVMPDAHALTVMPDTHAHCRVTCWLAPLGFCPDRSRFPLK